MSRMSSNVLAGWSDAGIESGSSSVPKMPRGEASASFAFWTENSAPPEDVTSLLIAPSTPSISSMRPRIQGSRRVYFLLTATSCSSRRPDRDSSRRRTEAAAGMFGWRPSFSCWRIFRTLTASALPANKVLESEIAAANRVRSADTELDIDGD